MNDKTPIRRQKKDGLKTRTLGNGKITEAFWKALDEASKTLRVSKTYLLELAFYDFMTDNSNFLTCDGCSERVLVLLDHPKAGTLVGNCPHCGRAYEVDFEAA